MAKKDDKPNKAHDAPPEPAPAPKEDAPASLTPNTDALRDLINFVSKFDLLLKLRPALEQAAKAEAAVGQSQTTLDDIATRIALAEGKLSEVQQRTETTQKEHERLTGLLATRMDEQQTAIRETMRRNREKAMAEEQDLAKALNAKRAASELAIKALDDEEAEARARLQGLLVQITHAQEQLDAIRTLVGGKV